VTTAQEDAWRAYTSALIAFFDHPMPPPAGGLDDRHGPDGDPQQPPAPRPGPTTDPVRPLPLVSERIADRAIDQGEKAKALKVAVEALRSTLNADQLKRLASAEDSLRPPPRGPHHGPDGRHGEHGPRDRASPPPMPRGDIPPPSSRE